MPPPSQSHGASISPDTSTPRLRLRERAEMAVIAAAIAGYGIAQLPHSLAEASIEDGKLRRVLGDYTTPVGGLYAVYPSSRHLSPLVKAFIDLAARRLSGGGTSEDDNAVAASSQNFG
jgi:DNA-binding transcriptional LysR family regulator